MIILAAIVIAIGAKFIPSDKDKQIVDPGVALKSYAGQER